MHTDKTLEVLEVVSGNLGSQLRIFVHDTCSAFSTRELCHKAESRIIKYLQYEHGNTQYAHNRVTMPEVYTE